jgi:hypothetical protein
MTDEEIASLRRNQCPTCTNWGLLAGPRGGAGQNLYCANPQCRAAFLVAPRHDIHCAHRLGEAPDHYYPPQVHIITPGGHPHCNFAGSLTIDNGPPPRIVPTSPDAWPVGHAWVMVDRFEQSTCKACRERARS